MIEHPSGAIEWHHKDGTRNYWSIRAWPTDAPPTDPVYGAGDVIWAYDIRTSGGGRSWEDIHAGRIEVMDGKLLAYPEDIMADYLAHVAAVMVGFAQSHGERYGPGEDPIAESGEAGKK